MPKVAVALLDTIEEATREALEEMFFMVIFDRLGHPCANSADLVAEVQFAGDATGIVRIALSRAAASEAAANFLGEDADCLSEDQIRSVVCELTNIICGSALSRWQHQASFTLSQPQCVACRPNGSIELAGGSPGRGVQPIWTAEQSCAFQLENGSIAVWVCLEPGEFTE
jgi:CheY-specific phosphatase CheX